MRELPNRDGFIAKPNEIIAHYNEELSVAIGKLLIDHTSIKILVTLCAQVGAHSAYVCRDREHFDRFKPTLMFLIDSSGSYVLAEQSNA